MKPRKQEKNGEKRRKQEKIQPKLFFWEKSLTFGGLCGKV